jgi:hypothetical protein
LSFRKAQTSSRTPRSTKRILRWKHCSCGPLNFPQRREKQISFSAFIKLTTLLGAGFSVLGISIFWPLVLN